METGTGKTYVYTRSMFELNRQYGWSKFIIMVPSIAIREGVNKSLEITAEHFQEIYGKKIRFSIYNTKNKSNLSNIKNFANTANIEVIIMNYQAFATNSEDARKIYQEMDTTNSEKPIDIIKRARPILLIDEPQKF
jgi:type III restriction enzyme